jgi:hypothetical protein
VTRKLLTAALCILLFSCGEDPSGPSGSLSVTVTSPPAEGAYATDTYTVNWAGEGSGTVALYYNTVQSPIGQQFIASGLAVSGAHQWDLSLVPSGDYMVRAIISNGLESASGWSQGALQVDHSSGDPGITITAPPPEGEVANESYTLRWASSGFVDGLVTLWYDTDTLPGSEVPIAASLLDKGEYAWDCSSVPDGSYYIKAEITDGTDSASTYSQGMLLISHVPNPWITVEKPPAAGETANNTYTIEWSSEAPTGATVTLWYDTDTNPSDGLIAITTGLGNDGYFTWECSDIPEGQYYIYAQLMSATDSRSTVARLAAMVARDVLASSYSQGTLTITHDIPWNITVVTPPAEGATADNSYQIDWTSDAPPINTLDIYYASDTTGATLYPVASGVANSGTHLWNTEMVPDGSWYVYATLTGRAQSSDWSSGRVTILHEDEYTFDFTAPPPEGASADAEYMLQWDTSAPYGSTWVYLYYSTSNEPGGTLTPIVQGTPNAGQYNWNCSGVSDNEYWIYGFVTDERLRNPEVISRGSGSAWSEGTLTVNHSGYSIEITAPPAAGAAADSSYTVEWTASGGTGSLIALYYDDDIDPGNGMVMIAEGLSNSGSYLWDTTVVPEGNWYVYGAIYDPGKGGPNPEANGFAGAYSQGMLTIQHEYNYIIVTAPPPWGAYAQTEFQIQWAASTPYGGTVSLYYDVDTNPGNGMEFIVNSLAWDDGQYMWDCSTTPEGEYYIYAKLENSQQTLTSYSIGTLIIDREPLWMSFYSPPPPGATADASYTLEWYSVGPAGRTVDLYYDTDLDPGQGLTLIAADVACPDYLSTYVWNCSAVPDGSYYIYGILSDPSIDGTFEMYSEGMLTINHN